MRVDEKLTRAQYYTDPRFARKKPGGGSYKQKQGDNVQPASKFEQFERLAREQREAAARTAAGVPTTDPAAITFEQFAKIYVERGPQASCKASWKDDKYLLATVGNHRTGHRPSVGRLRAPIDHRG